MFMESVRRHTPAIVLDSISWLGRQLPNLDPIELLPLGIDVLKGAIVIGNPSTPTLLVAQFQKAVGIYGVTQVLLSCISSIQASNPYKFQSISKHDYYKTSMNLKFQEAQLNFVDNEDYYGSQTFMGDEVKARIDERAYFQSHLDYSSFTKIWRQLRLLKYLLTIPPSTATKRFEPTKIFRGKSDHGEHDNFGGDFSEWEYAIETKILSAPVLELYYYVDVPGPVPPSTQDGSIGHGNLDSDPEWGIDVVIRRGVLKYGPWADRQR